MAQELTYAFPPPTPPKPPDRIMCTATRAEDRKRIKERLAARVTTPGETHRELPYEQVKSMLRERLSALLMQNRRKLRGMFQKYDTHNHSMLGVEQMYKMLRDLGCTIDIEDVEKLVTRSSSTGQKISFQEFCTNFLGLPDGFFSKDFSKFGSDDGPAKEDTRGGKLPLPRGTPIDVVQRQFVNSLREQMFDTGAVLSHALFRPNPRVEYMSKDEFWNILRGHGCMVSRCQLDEIFEYFDHNCDSLLHYEELACELLGLKRPAAVRHQAPHRFERRPLNPSSQRVVNMLRVVCERAAATPKKIYDMFRAYDVDGSGEIAYDEFEAMVKQVGCRVKGMNSAEELLRRFNTKGNGALSYVEFITNVMRLQPDAMSKPGEQLKPSSPELQHSVGTSIKRHLMNDSQGVKRALSFFDRDHGGDISLKEFSDGLESLGLPIARHQVKQLFNEIDTDGSGHIDHIELASSVLGIDNGKAKTLPSRMLPDEPTHRSQQIPSKLSYVPRSAASNQGRPQTSTVQTPMIPKTPMRQSLTRSRQRDRTPQLSKPGTPMARAQTPGSHSRVGTPNLHRPVTPAVMDRLRTPHSQMCTPKGALAMRRESSRRPMSMHSKKRAERPSTRMAEMPSRPGTSMSALQQLDGAKVQQMLDKTFQMRQQIQQVGQAPVINPLDLSKAGTPQGDDKELQELHNLSQKLNSFASELSHLSTASARVGTPAATYGVNR